jgi:hypothetical protein
MTTETLMTAQVCCCGNCEAAGHEKETLRPLTAQEITEANAREEEYLAQKANQDAAAAAKAAAKASAESKLTALGLTLEEISALG